MINYITAIASKMWSKYAIAAIAVVHKITATLFVILLVIVFVHKIITKGKTNA